MSLNRYKILYMQKIPADAPEAMPEAVRQDTRKHTKHCLRPTKVIVESYQSGVLEWEEFADKYRSLLASRFGENRAPFDSLAKLAKTCNVYLGCSCPTKSNPDVNHCHTVLALQFMHEHYPSIIVKFPKSTL